VSDYDKSKDELVAELVALRQRVKDLEMGGDFCESPEYKRSKEDADFYLTILDEAPALIWRAARNAKCDWFNATWLGFTGREMKDELGDGWAEGVHPEDFSRCLDTYLGAFHARRFFEMEYRLRRHDGEFRWILDIGCPFKDVDGQFAGYIGYCFDVTERKEDEQFRAEVERIIRHDIKTPLSGLHGLAEVALSDGIDSELQALVPELLRAIRHVIGLVDAGDKFALLEQGRYEPESAWFDVNAVVRDVERSLGQLVQGRNIQLRSETPSQNGSVQYFGEEFLFYDMVLNIVKNAVEASPCGRDVVIDFGRADDAFRLCVRNAGAVPEKIRTCFFDKFVTSGKCNGTGLGTYSAQLIARAHGGRIDFSTSDEGGTAVTIVLPNRKLNVGLA